MAQQELTNRGDVFTHDALAFALAVAGRTTEAQQHATQALSEGTVDARLFLHAGIIAALNNDVTQAKRRLQQASAIQQMLLPSERVQLEAWRQKIDTKQRSNYVYTGLETGSRDTYARANSTGQRSRF